MVAAFCLPFSSRSLGKKMEPNKTALALGRSCRKRKGNALYHLSRHYIINGGKLISTNIAIEKLTIIASPGDAAGARTLWLPGE